MGIHIAHIFLGSVGKTSMADSVMENNWECRLLRAVMEHLSEKMTWHLLSEGQKRTRPLKLSKMTTSPDNGRSMSKRPEAGKSLAHVGIERKPRWQGRNEL